MNTLDIQSLHALPWLLSTLIKATVILIAAWAACLCLKRASASTRHLIWSAALIALLLLPCLSLALPHWEVVFHNANAIPVRTQSVAPPAPLPPALPNMTKPVSVKPPPAAHVMSPSNARTGRNPVVSVASPRRFAPFVAVVIGAGSWFVGFAIVLGQFVLGLRRIGQISKNAVFPDDATLATAEAIRKRLGIRTMAFLRAAQDGVAVPVTWGALNPVVLLPAQSASWSDACLRAALLHELAHVQRGDWLTQTLARLTCAVYWWHPLVWFSARQTREESERACDDFVLGTGVGAADYAERLVEVVRSMPNAAFSRTVAIAMAQPSEVEGRVEAILDKRRNRSRLTKLRLATALCAVCLLLLPLSALQPIARAGADTTPVSSDASLGQSVPMGRGILELYGLQGVASSGDPMNASRQPYQIETIPNADGTQSKILVDIRTGARYRDPKTVQDALQKLIDRGYTERPGAYAYLIPLNLAIDVPTREVFFTTAQRKQADALEIEKTVLLDLLDKSPVVVTDADLASATGHLNYRSQPVLDLKFTATGAQKLKEFTQTHQGAVLGILVDGGLISAPKIVAEIDDGFAQISGGFCSLAEVKALADRLNQPTTQAGITPTSYDSISPDGTEMIVRGGSADSVPVATGSEVMLPNGYTVGVAGLTQAVRAGDKWSMFGGHWWKPDGTPLAAPLDDPKAGFWNWSVRQHDGDAPYVAKFTLTPRQTDVTKPGQEISTYEEFIGAENRLALLDRMPFTRGEGSYGGSTQSIYFAPGTKTCAIRCGVGAGPWQTAATLPVHLTPDTVKLPTSSRPYDRAAVEFKLDDRPALMYDSADGKRRTEYFLGTERLKNVARRIVAVEVSGKEIPLQVMGNGGWGLQFISLGFDKKYSLFYFNPTVNLAQVKEFRLETRPYQIVEFRNVQLQPNGGTGNAAAQGAGRAKQDFLNDVAKFNADELNMRRLDLTIIEYAQDHDLKLPPMRTEAALESALEPYVNQQEKYPDPATGKPYALRGKKVFISPLTDKPYLFAQAMSGRPVAEIISPAATILFTDASSSTPGGVQRGFNAFADGHVKQISE